MSGTNSRHSNILDPIHPTLDPRLYDRVEDDNPRLKAQHAHWIKRRIKDALEKAGYEHIDTWLSLVLTGSLTTFQYSDESDVDVSLFVDSEHFPEWSRAEMIGVMVSKIDGTILPGTPWPMQCFVVPPDITRQMLYQPGLRSGYDLDEDKWIIPPERDRVHDVKAQEYNIFAYAEECADKMDRLLRYEPDRAVTYWHQIHDRRRRDMRAGKGDFAPSNVVYKMLANRGLFPEIAEASGEYIAKVAGSQILPVEEIKQGMMVRPRGTSLPFQEARADAMRDPEHPGDCGETHQEWEDHCDEHMWVVPFQRTFSPHDPEGSLWEVQPRTSKVAAQPPKWRLDPIAVDKAAFHLGIKHPVKVTIEGGTHAQYIGFQNGTHLIKAVWWVRPELANEQIWHELVHALQFEEGMQFHEDPAGLPHDEYRALPEEVDARERAANPPFSVVIPIRVAGPHRDVRKFVYRGDTGQLIIGDLGPEEGVLPSHHQLGEKIGLDWLTHPFAAGTVSQSGYVQFEAGSKQDVHKTRRGAELALKKALPNDIKGFIGGESTFINDNDVGQPTWQFT